MKRLISWSREGSRLCKLPLEVGVGSCVDDYNVGGNLSWRLGLDYV